MSLHIGFNLQFLTERSGGVGRYAEELMRALLLVDPTIRLTAFATADVHAAFRMSDVGREISWQKVPGRPLNGNTWNSIESVRSQWAVQPWRASRLGLDVLHGPANVVAIASRVPTVVTLHDLIWMHHPETMAAKDTLRTRLLTVPSAKRSRRIITGSADAKRDLVTSLGVPPGKIDVVLHGVRTDPAPATPPATVREQLGLGEDQVILSVAQKRTHKNLGALVRSMDSLRDLPALLVLVGAPTPHEDELKALSASLGVADRVRFVNWLPQPDLEGLYATASVFALPSLMEGFGLPVLEAMARGAPVACSNVSALPEAAGDAGLLFDPLDEADVVNALRRILTDPALASRLRRAGTERAGALTWEATAEKTLETYRRAIRGWR